MPAHHPGQVRKLNEDEYKATMSQNPIRVGLDEEPPFDFWPYFEEIPTEDFGDHDFSEGVVPYAWKMSGSSYEHVLVECPTPNVFMVLVLDVADRSVTGHHLLDLNLRYGLTDSDS